MTSKEQAESDLEKFAPNIRLCITYGWDTLNLSFVVRLRLTAP